ncbi:PspC domain-containing protein [Candidatus Saccharibacteria bacterium]|nr:MAG: PspC domain-containing protein [Candidatus Saccharibacteria bacterium]
MTQQEPKRLYRSTTNKMLAGVCGGFAEYFNIDPVVVRLLAAGALLLGFFPAFFAYLICWMVVPEKPLA